MRSSEWYLHGSEVRPFWWQTSQEIATGENTTGPFHMELWLRYNGENGHWGPVLVENADAMFAEGEAWLRERGLLNE